MSQPPLRTVLDRLWASVRSENDPTVADAELLRRFVAGRDAAAFELLLWRHGPMVSAVCRRLLRHEQDVEDAFQATFLVLARKAGTIGKRQAVGSWLYKVAYRAALKARMGLRTRHERQQPLPDIPQPAGADPQQHELTAHIDQAIGRLPEKYRAAFVLRYLEGKSVAAAAAELGCARGTILSRLFRARQRLRRLLPRGLVLTPALLAAVPVPCNRTTLTAALAFASGAAPSTASATLLAQGVLRHMLVTKSKNAAAMFLAAVLTLCGLGLLWQQTAGAGPSADSSPSQPIPPPAGGERADNPPVEKPDGAIILTHKDKVLAVAFSPSGKLLAAAGGYDRTIRLWDVTTGKEKAPLGEHPDFVRCLAFSPDGKTLAVGGSTFDARGEGPDRVRIWNLATGKEQTTFKPAADKKSAGATVTRLAFNPADGNMLAVACRDGFVHVWDLAGARETGALAGPRECIAAVAFSARGKLLAVGGTKATGLGIGEVVLWDTTRWKEVGRQEMPCNGVRSVAFSPDDELLAAGCGNGEVCLIDVAKGFRKTIPPREHSSSVTAIAFLADAFADEDRKAGIAPRWVMAIAEENEVRFLEVPAGKVLARLRAHTRGVNCLAISPDARLLASGGWDNVVRLWQVAGVGRADSGKPK